MKKNKYELTTNFMSGALSSQANFAFRQENKTACWLWAQPSFGKGKSGVDQATLDQILADFIKKPTMSSARLQEYLYQVKRRLGAESGQWPQFDPSMLLMVSDYSKVVWTMSGDLALYRIHKGHLRAENHHSTLQRWMGIQPDLQALRAKKNALHHEDVYVIVNSKLAKNISTEELKAILSGKRHLDRHIAVAAISVNQIVQPCEKESVVWHDLRRREVITPVLIVACSGMLAVFQIESQWTAHRAALHKPAVIAHQKLTAPKAAPQLQALPSIQPLASPQSLEELVPQTEIIADLGSEATKKLNTDPVFPEIDKVREFIPGKKIESASKSTELTAGESKESREYPEHKLKSATASSRIETSHPVDKTEKPVEQKGRATVKGGQVVQNASEGLTADNQELETENSNQAGEYIAGDGTPPYSETGSSKTATSEEAPSRSEGVGVAENNTEMLQVLGSRENKKPDGIDKLLKSFETERVSEETSSQPPADSEPVE